MPSERDFQNNKNPNVELRMHEYNIVGNVFRAYRNATGDLVFVVDDTVTAVKPNVVLVMDSVDGRKWDDVLANDFGVDLEVIRPKKDNKYQKLDIEYDGLAHYARLIDAYENDADIAAALVELARFRSMSGRRAATERLNAAEDVAARARDTIARTDETISELTARVKELRSQLSSQRRAVGREPTKKTAARILRTESQIDAVTEKLGRAKKRLSNARRRLLAAEEDAQIAREILQNESALLPPADDVRVGGDVAIIPPNDVVVAEAAPAPAVMGAPMMPVPVFTEYNPEQSEPKAEEMADEEVKPLFDKDPEILDEEIAFKPIDFNMGPSVDAPAVPEFDSDVYENATPAPLSFAPPAAADVIAPADEVVITPAEPEVAPVLDTIISVDVPQNVPDVAPALAPVTEYTEQMRPAPISPIMPNTPDAIPVGVAAAPISSGMRPVSPVTGTSTPSSGVAPVVTGGRRPNLLYYIMLVVLIALSIFTLWLYQKNVGQNVPDLATTAPAPEQVAPDVVEEVIVAPAPVVEPEPVTEPEPVAMPAPEPVPVVAEPESAPMPAPEPVPVETPFLTPEPVVAPVAEPEPVPAEKEEPVVNKPAYNVSQNENMFVAAPEYDTETIVKDAATVDVAPGVVMPSKPVTQISEPAVVYEYDQMLVASEPVATPGTGADADVCTDGRAPDRHGCCAGEIFTDMEDGTFMCCSTDGVECFEPLL